MRNKFNEQLELLNKKMVEMGALCEDLINIAVKALLDGNYEVAKTVIPLGSDVDRLEKEIEGICMRLLLQQQPVARDLRQMSAALKMITDMERIGDQAEDISEIVVFLNGRRGEECKEIRMMAEATANMVKNSVDAFVKQNLELAKAVIDYDDFVDECFLKVKNNLIEMIAKNVKDGEYVLDLLMIAKYFERIGDHATNIAEWVEFSITGIHKGEKEL